MQRFLIENSGTNQAYYYVKLCLKLCLQIGSRISESIFELIQQNYLRSQSVLELLIQIDNKQKFDWKERDLVRLVCLCVLTENWGTEEIWLFFEKEFLDKKSINKFGPFNQ